MLREDLIEILRHESGEVLKTPRLLMLMLSVYSKLFLNDQPCSTCEKKHEAYFSRLKKEGIKQLEKINTMEKQKTKYKFKTENGGLYHQGEYFNTSNLTDEIVERLCQDSPRFRNQFINPPEIKEDAKQEIAVPEKVVSEVIPVPEKVSKTKVKRYPKRVKK
ncbi:MAG: hypothetical protein WC139_13790 [Candidatus Kapaibacterium sp.]